MIYEYKSRKQLSEEIYNIHDKVNEIIRYLNVADIDTYPLVSYENEDEVVDYTKPVGHVDRYGALGDYIWDDPQSGTDNTRAIQIAVDTVLRNGGGVVQFGDGIYKIDGTVYLNTKWHRLITLKGVDGKYMSFYQMSGGKSVLVKNTTGDMFKVNLNENNEGANGTDGGMYNVTIKNLAIISNKAEVEVTGFHTFTSRIQMENVLGSNIHCLVKQDEYDATNDFNYCDFSSYRNINLTDIKDIGLDLKMADSCIIEGIYCHSYDPTCQHLINIKGGSGFSISNCIFTMQFDNLSSGVDGTTSFIKIDNCKGFTIRDTFIERSYLTNGISLSRCQNAKIQGISDIYYSNTLIKLHNCQNISIDGIYRDVFLTNDYYDIYFSGTNKAIAIHNATVKRRQAEPGQNSPSSVERTMIFGGSINRSELRGDNIQVILKYDGTDWVITDDKGNAVNELIAKGKWTGSTYQFEGSCKIGKGLVKALSGCILTNSIAPYQAILRNTDTYTSIQFVDNGSVITSGENYRMACVISVDIF